jgi:hypothetical protein
VFTLLACLAFAAPAAAQSLDFADSGPLTSDTGHVMVEWRASEPVTLIIAPSADFPKAKALYSGRNHSFFLSGLDSGKYWLLLRDRAGHQSRPLELTVVHQSLTAAILLTIVGAFITLSIIATIIRGARP